MALKVVIYPAEEGGYWAEVGRSTQSLAPN